MDMFWIVWSPTGTSPPRFKHGTLDSARTESERLARAAPNAEFFVMACVGRSKKVDVSWTTPDQDDEIPF